MGIHVYTMHKKHIKVKMFDIETKIGQLKFAFEPIYLKGQRKLVPEQQKIVEATKKKWESGDTYRFVSIVDTEGRFRDKARVFKLPPKQFYWFDEDPLIHVGYIHKNKGKWFFLPARQYLIINKTDDCLAYDYPFEREEDTKKAIQVYRQTFMLDGYKDREGNILSPLDVEFEVMETVADQDSVFEGV